MCLHLIQYTYPRANTDIRVGYKVFEIDPKTKTLNGAFYKTKPFKVGDTIIDKNPGYYSDSAYIEYPLGFHIYKTLKGAKYERSHRPKRYKIFRVLYTNIVVTGEQHGFDVDVARRMRILEQITK